jgi:hypothetical protein
MDTLFVLNVALQADLHLIAVTAPPILEMGAHSSSADSFSDTVDLCDTYVQSQDINLMPENYWFVS